MWFANRTGAVPAYLQTAVEYRERLIAELAKVDAFLLDAGKSAWRPEYETMDFFLLGSAEIPETASL